MQKKAYRAKAPAVPADVVNTLNSCVTAPPPSSSPQSVSCQVSSPPVSTRDSCDSTVVPSAKTSPVAVTVSMSMSPSPNTVGNLTPPRPDRAPVGGNTWGETSSHSPSSPVISEEGGDADDFHSPRFGKEKEPIDAEGEEETDSDEAEDANHVREMETEKKKAANENRRRRKTPAHLSYQTYMYPERREKRRVMTVAELAEAAAMASGGGAEELNESLNELPPGFEAFLLPGSETGMEVGGVGTEQMYLDLHNCCSSRCFNSRVAQTLVQVVENVKQSCILDIVEIIKGGAVGKGTAVTGSCDAELVLVMREGKLPTTRSTVWMPPMMRSVAAVLGSSAVPSGAATRVYATENAVMVETAAGVQVRIRVCPQVGGSKEELRRTYAAADVEGRRLLEPLFMRDEVHLVSRQSGQVKITIRLMKWWRGQQAWSSPSAVPSDYLIELLAIQAHVATRPKDQPTAIKAVLALMASFTDLSITSIAVTGAPDVTTKQQSASTAATHNWTTTGSEVSGTHSVSNAAAPSSPSPSHTLSLKSGTVTDKGSAGDGGVHPSPLASAATTLPSPVPSSSSRYAAPSDSAGAERERDEGTPIGVPPGVLSQRPLILDPSSRLRNVADPSIFDGVEMMKKAGNTKFFW
uniref:Uncharacterized protein n=1 Tax=Chromera velia CCMP2878 TaxID=1169474 RepID=A0A0G4FWE3_9ALVE|eukprot:Cvel_19113.t1-p1 / transcript=Cvel_19113.t1 / gene=Cvel_19113 / organism=Chromera_velia_CCMP2878 / gene_product=hypothetical protein / transcript_product=hypothetical protein / location=Cvel_scaffold1623:28087-32194(+) / protein_length=635 / sequence_SO=supercontig / SO=protein_coding / is_pseudo=false